MIAVSPSLWNAHRLDGEAEKAVEGMILTTRGMDSWKYSHGDRKISAALYIVR